MCSFKFLLIRHTFRMDKPVIFRETNYVQSNFCKVVQRVPDILERTTPNQPKAQHHSPSNTIGDESNVSHPLINYAAPAQTTIAALGECCNEERGEARKSTSSGIDLPAQSAAACVEQAGAWRSTDNITAENNIHTDSINTSVVYSKNSAVFNPSGCVIEDGADKLCGDTVEYGNTYHDCEVNSSPMDQRIEGDFEDLVGDGEMLRGSDEGFGGNDRQSHPTLETYDMPAYDCGVLDPGTIHDGYGADGHRYGVDGPSSQTDVLPTEMHRSHNYPVTSNIGYDQDLTLYHTDDRIRENGSFYPTTEENVNFHEENGHAEGVDGVAFMGQPSPGECERWYHREDLHDHIHNDPEEDEYVLNDIGEADEAKETPLTFNIVTAFTCSEETTDFIGFGEEHLCLTQRHHNRVDCIVERDNEYLCTTRELPTWLASDCDKYVTRNYMACQNNTNEPTLIVSHNLDCKAVHRQCLGHLCGVLSGNRLVYVHGAIESCQVNVYQLVDDDIMHTQTLSRPDGPFRSYCISICKSKPTKDIAVLDCATNTVELYNQYYQHRRQIILPTDVTTLGWNALANIDKKLAVGCEAGLLLYSWEGELIQAIDVATLGFEGKILGIGSSLEGLHVAVGNGNIVRHLYLLTVGDTSGVYQ